MPEIDFAILCNSATQHENMISILDGPIDTVVIKQLPAQLHLTLAIRFLWSSGELEREHRGDIIFQDEDGKQLIKIDFRTNVQRSKDSIHGWKTGSNMILAFPLIIEKFGQYSFEILVDDKEMKTLPFRAING